MKANSDNAFIHEIFSSIQGEGILLGLWQIFVRFRGCNLQCQSCDTRTAWESSSEPVQVFSADNYSSPRQVPNPLSGNQLDALITGFNATDQFHSHVVITGGEPLEQHEFLADWLPSISRKFKIMLETSAFHYEEVKHIRKYISYAAMDYKLPSFSGKTCFDDHHLQFYRIMARVPGCIKLVVTPTTSLEEIKHAGTIIKKSHWDQPVIIQPSREYRALNTGKLMEKVRNMTTILKNHVAEVRFIPQMHEDWKLP